MNAKFQKGDYVCDKRFNHPVFGTVIAVVNNGERLVIKTDKGNFSVNADMMEMVRPKKTKYSIPVRFTGRVIYDIEADSEEEAMKIAAELGLHADCGELTDVDWEAKPAVEVIK